MLWQCSALIRPIRRPLPPIHTSQAIPGASHNLPRLCQVVGEGCIRVRATAYPSVSCAASHLLHSPTSHEPCRQAPVSRTQHSQPCRCSGRMTSFLDYLGIFSLVQCERSAASKFFESPSPTRAVAPVPVFAPSSYHRLPACRFNSTSAAWHDRTSNAKRSYLQDTFTYHSQTPIPHPATLPHSLLSIPTSPYIPPWHLLLDARH